MIREAFRILRREYDEDEYGLPALRPLIFVMLDVVMSIGFSVAGTILFAILNTQWASLYAATTSMWIAYILLRLVREQKGIYHESNIMAYHLCRSCGLLRSSSTLRTERMTAERSSPSCIPVVRKNYSNPEENLP